MRNNNDPMYSNHPQTIKETMDGILRCSHCGIGIPGGSYCGMCSGEFDPYSIALRKKFKEEREKELSSMKEEIISSLKEFIKKTDNKCKHYWMNYGSDTKAVVCQICNKTYSPKEIFDILDNLDDEATCQGN